MSAIVHVRNVWPLTWGSEVSRFFLFLALSISALKLMKHEEHEEEEDPLSGRCWLLRSGPQR